MRQTFLGLVVFVSRCNRQPEPPPKAVEADTGALDVYDIMLSTDTVAPGEPISFCFKAHNAVRLSGRPGKFAKQGALEGDCLVDSPQVDTLYQIEVTGADGTYKMQSAYVKVRQ